MTRKEKLAERKALEAFYYNCKLETPEEVAKLFDVYTRLIWEYHQTGLCYDYYCDTTWTRLEGTGAWIGGHDALEVETLPAIGPKKNRKCNFKQIFCVGDPENGYHFGQVTSPCGEFAKEGAIATGRGDGSVTSVDEVYTLCECYVKKVEGRWVITDEWVVSGQEVCRQQVKGAQPFAKTILDVYGEGKYAPVTVEELSAQMDKEEK